MSTRICVKNIPKHLTEERFRNHFASRGEVTDVQIIRKKDGKSRQFGFIGYKTPEEAEAALRHFNRTFLDTSRILVESAQKVGDEKLARPWSKYSKGSSAHTKYEENVNKRNEQKKRKTGESVESDDSTNNKKEQKKKQFLDGITEEEENDPKLKQFLEIMKPRTVKKIWENDAVAGAENPNKKQKVLVTSSAVQSKKTGGQGVFLEKTHMKFDDSDASDDDLYEDMPANKNIKEEEAEDEDMEDVNTETVAHNSAVSDLDYLKSKMKKLPDNDDDEEEAEDDDDDNNNVDEEENQDEETGESVESVQKEAKKPKKKSDDNNNNEKMQEHEDEEEKNDDQEEKDEEDSEKEKPIDEGRLFLRNLAYSTTEDDLVALCNKFGDLGEIHLPVHPTTKKPLGYAFVSFLDPVHAAHALSKLDGTIFQGRLLHVLPGKAKLESDKNDKDDNLTKEQSFKQKKEKERRANSEKSHNWNALFMNSDAVAESIAARLGVTKSDLLDRESNDNLAVRLALAETQIINETKKFLEEEGISLDTLGAQNDKSVKRSKTVILVKNIPFSTELNEIRALFSPFGQMGRCVLPPAKTIALVEFLEPNDAKKAFRGLAYKNFKHAPLYLEWAPTKVFTTAPVRPNNNSDSSTADNNQNNKSEEKEIAAPVLKKTDIIEDDVVDEDSAETSTLFVKNLNFGTTDEVLKEHFAKVGNVRSVTVAKKADMKNPGQKLSMGYGFVEFKSKEDAVKALKHLQNAELEGHALQLKFSKREGSKEQGSKSRKNQASQSSTKLVVKNLPFEANRKDIMELCKPFGKLKSCRVPKKFDGHSRGFAFVEFLTKQEAANAREALQSTHLYGRHLVFDYALEDNGDVAVLQAKTKQKFKGNSE